MRKLVTLRTVSEIRDIPDADNIVCATVDGWDIVTRVGEFSVGDIGVYFEIDSFISDTDKRFDFLEKIKRTWQNNSGYRIKTIKLKKQISQGLLLPLHMFPEIVDPQFDTDYADQLNVIKWEAPTVASLYSDAAGLFPSFIPKTDAERCLSGDTMVTTDIGTKTLRDICENTLSCRVQSYNIIENRIEMKDVIGYNVARKLNKNAKWLKIHFDDGTFLTVTPEHLIFVPLLNVYREAKDLTIDDFILKTDH